MLLLLLQDATELPLEILEEPAGAESLTLLETLVLGGWVLIPIFLLSILAIYIFVERVITVHKAAADPEATTRQIRNYVQNGDIRGAVAYCESQATPISRILKQGLERLGRPIMEIQDAVQAAGKHEAFELEKRTDILASIAGIAPMLGFFGTVTGMIKAFQAIQNLQGNVNPSVLAGGERAVGLGRWIALITTAVGLAVGIVALFFYNYLIGRINRLVNDMERSATDFIDLLQEPAPAAHSYEERVY